MASRIRTRFKEAITVFRTIWPELTLRPQKQAYVSDRLAAACTSCLKPGRFVGFRHPVLFNDDLEVRSAGGSAVIYEHLRAAIQHFPVKKGPERDSTSRSPRAPEASIAGRTSESDPQLW